MSFSEMEKKGCPFPENPRNGFETNVLHQTPSRKSQNCDGKMIHLKHNGDDKLQQIATCWSQTTQSL
jgi:hypothetical protein